MNSDHNNEVKIGNARKKENKIITDYRTFKWDIPIVLIGSQVSINAVKHNY